MEGQPVRVRASAARFRSSGRADRGRRPGSREGDSGTARRDRAISGDRRQDLEPSGCGGRTAVRPQHPGNGCIRHPPEAVMKSSLYWRWGAALILLLVLIALSPAFGATWDERALQAYGEQIWDYYRGQRALGDIDVGFGYTRIYGGLVEFLSSAAQHVIPANQYIVRHGVNAVFGWTGVVFVFLMALKFFGTRAAWLAAALLVVMPRYLAESMNNTKDLPFAVLMLAGLYYILTIKPEYPYVSWSHALKLAVAIALALDVRSMGLVLFGYTG